MKEEKTSVDVEKIVDDDFDFSKILEEGYLKNKDARRVGSVFGNEWAMCITEDQAFAYEDNNTPKLLKAGIIEGIREEFNRIDWKEYNESIKSEIAEYKAQDEARKANALNDALAGYIRCLFICQYFNGKK